MNNTNALINTENILAATAANFDELALAIFHYQYKGNSLYNAYCKALNIKPESVTESCKIPFLPISFFKSHRVTTGDWAKEALLFESSGTTGEITSKHYVRDASLYDRSLYQGFEQFYGSPEQYTILALLPSYLERKNASLVYMARKIMEKSGHPENGFYINEWAALHDKLTACISNNQKTILLGVTFALLDFAADHPTPLGNTIVMETGGMKGRHEEWTRAQVHQYLKQQWQLSEIQSEYGMTELLSQAYAMCDGIYKPANTMKVLVRDINDPLDVKPAGTGCINIIDLANIHSCSFIATEDIGHVHENGNFEVLGRMDHSALRGCSLMAI